MKYLKASAYTLFILVMTVLAAGIFLSLSSFHGFRVFAVRSGSMEPAIQTGSIVLVKQQASYALNDVITFLARSRVDLKESGATITHRIVGRSIDTDTEQVFITQGDANEEPDGALVTSNKVLGKTVLSIPYIGYVVNFAQTEIGFIALVIIPGTLIIYQELQVLGREIRQYFARNKQDHAAA